MKFLHNFMDCFESLCDYQSLKGVQSGPIDLDVKMQHALAKASMVPELHRFWKWAMSSARCAFPSTCSMDTVPFYMHSAKTAYDIFPNIKEFTQCPVSLTSVWFGTHRGRRRMDDLSLLAYVICTIPVELPPPYFLWLKCNHKIQTKQLCHTLFPPRMDIAQNAAIPVSIWRQGRSIKVMGWGHMSPSQGAVYVYTKERHKSPM
ncbi:hypothetical protein EDD18DRAFT_1107763 [Armillaria luteobubalina]|uniref:Uncharacterized protein n=1 Tax=Armillaria luteobubalina TaxID=153913 RepID=A0AA39UL34_9AGAR|nr:hypothetical protein EDD18DRAFT_1107763 [Armillaria luteobubalina]